METTDKNTLESVDEKNTLESVDEKNILESVDENSKAPVNKEGDELMGQDKKQHGTESVEQFKKQDFTEPDGINVDEEMASAVHNETTSPLKRKRIKDTSSDKEDEDTPRAKKQLTAREKAQLELLSHVPALKEYKLDRRGRRPGISLSSADIANALGTMVGEKL
jgi:hypothetical protein